MGAVGAGLRPSKTEGVILGIDPSYSCTGLVAWDGASVRYQARLRKIVPGPVRLLRAAKLFKAAIDGVHAPIELAVIEDAAYGSPNRVVVGKLCALAGIFKFILEAKGIDYLEVSPTFVKRYVCGKGTAEKYQVSNELDKKYGIAFENDPGFDLSDAAALATWGWENRHGKR